MEGIKIENIVASSQISEGLDLWEVHEALEESEYNPDEFPGLVYRLEEPKTSFLLFRSGKIVCTGANTFTDPQRGVEMVKEDLEDEGIDTLDEVNVEVQNIVSSYKLGADMDLSAVAISMGLEKVEYEPEQFPGLVYRPEDMSVVLLLFTNGKAVITGGKKKDELEAGVEDLKGELEGFGFLD